MAYKLDPKEVMTFEELLMGNTITQEALINLLEKRGLAGFTGGDQEAEERAAWIRQQSLI